MTREMNFRWIVATPQPSLACHLAKELGVSALLAQCLINRGFRELAPVGSFLSPRLKHLADPFLLPDMEQAVDRLFAARGRDERIVIFGDYDVDGVTSTTLLLEVLRGLGWTVHCYLPHRMDEGYGLTSDAVENCLRRNPATLVIAVDCGSTANGTVELLRARGIDVIVLDHHQVSNPPPRAVALVNPHLHRVAAFAAPSKSSNSCLGEPGPRLGADEQAAAGFTELCSVGLAFKLAHAVLKRGRQLGIQAAFDLDLRQSLDLVALGTIADLVPLTGENRILVSTGLDRLNRSERPGIVALKKVAQVTAPIGVYEVGYQLAPRLNAAGRLENAQRALDLLCARNLTEAESIAHELDAQNRQRQQIERNMADQITGSLRARFNPETDYVIVEGQLLWHIGVVGIVASRVVREFYRPTLIMGGEGEEWRGSGRSIDGFDLAAALRHCDDLLVRHGGHAMAAGLSVHPGKLDLLRARLNELARCSLSPEQLRPALRIDAEVALGELTVGGLQEVERLQPFGQGNAPVQLVTRRLTHQRPPQRQGKEKQHLKLWVTDGTAAIEAVSWNGAGRPGVEPPFDLVFAPQINEFNGRRSVQLKVLDYKASAASAMGL